MAPAVHPHFLGGGAPLRNRGSKRRLKRIRARDHLTVGFLTFAGFLLLLLFVVIPWLSSQADFHH